MQKREREREWIILIESSCYIIIFIHQINSPLILGNRVRPPFQKIATFQICEIYYNLQRLFFSLMAQMNEPNYMQFNVFHGKENEETTYQAKAFGTKNFPLHTLTLTHLSFSFLLDAQSSPYLLITSTVVGKGRKQKRQRNLV